MTLLKDLQGADQLPLEIITAIAREGEGGQRPQHRRIAREAAEIRLHAPDRQQDVAVNPMARFDLAEQIAEFGRLGRACLDPARRNGARQIVRQGL